MSERDPKDLPGLDPDQFVGEPPAGDSDPGGFVSDDQSRDRAAERGGPPAQQSVEPEQTGDRR